MKFDKILNWIALNHLKSYCIASHCFELILLQRFAFYHDVSIIQYFLVFLVLTWLFHSHSQHRDFKSLQIRGLIFANMNNSMQYWIVLWGLCLQVWDGMRKRKKRWGERVCLFALKSAHSALCSTRTLIRPVLCSYTNMILFTGSFT